MVQAIAMIISAVISYYGFKLTGCNDCGEAVGWLFLIVTTGIAVSIVIVICTQYFEQINDIEGIKKSAENKDIYSRKRDALTGIFKQHLAVEYPKYEKEIFDKLLPANISIVATMFPEIKMSEIILDFCKRISTLENMVYQQELDITESEKRIRIRLRNKMLFWFLLPEE